HRPALAAALALLATGLTAPAAAAATPRATTVPCGAVLTTSVRLAADVTCPDGRGLTLAADGIELNLNGHALTGPGEAYGTVGVRVAARDVVVRGGTVAGWGGGVVAGTDPYQERARGPVSAVVRGARLEGNGTGVDVQQDGAVAVRDSRFTGNGLAGGSVTDGRLLVEGSTADGNESGFSSFDVGWDGLVLRGTTVRGGEHGVGCSQDGHLVLEDSTVQRTATALEAFQCSARVEGSTFLWNDRHVRRFLVDTDTVRFRCSAFSRDGGPLGVPLTACDSAAPTTVPGTRVSGTFEPA
ncbi:hypothetical protein GTR00_21790, partial [Kineococcus sp. T90]